MSETTPTVSVSPVIPGRVRNPRQKEVRDQLEGKIPNPTPIEIYPSGYRLEARWDAPWGKEFFMIKTVFNGSVGYCTNLIVREQWEPSVHYYIPAKYVKKITPQRQPIVKPPVDDYTNVCRCAYFVIALELIVIAYELYTKYVM